MKVTVKIERNQLQVVTESKSKTCKPAQPFSTQRLLVGDFKSAQQCLALGARDLGLVGFWKGKHDVRVEVTDYYGDGISPVERQIYKEMIYDCIKVNRFEIELIKHSV